MRRELAPLLCAGCTFLADPKPADFDLDGDGVLVEQDCNDADASITRLDREADPIRCGDVFDGAFLDDRLDVFNCDHETEPRELITLSGPERVFWFTHDIGTDVRVWLDGVDPASKHDYLVAMQGAWCSVDRCVLGVRGDDSVDFHAGPNEGWIVIVSQGKLDWEFTLHVDCIAAVE